MAYPFTPPILRYPQAFCEKPAVARACDQAANDNPILIFCRHHETRVLTLWQCATKRIQQLGFDRRSSIAGGI
jgi:hypothetical protein